MLYIELKFDFSDVPYHAAVTVAIAVLQLQIGVVCATMVGCNPILEGVLVDSRRCFRGPKRNDSDRTNLEAYDMPRRDAADSLTDLSADGYSSAGTG